MGAFAQNKIKKEKFCKVTKHQCFSYYTENIWYN